jgi:hypothetical protein
MRMSNGRTIACAGKRMSMDEKLILVNGELVLSQNELKDRDIVGVVVFSTYC